MAAQELDVDPERGGDDRAGEGAVIAFDLAGEQRLEADGVALELHDLELEALLLGEAARHHHEDAGVALGLDDAVTPGRGALRQRGAGRQGGERGGRRGPADDPAEIHGVPPQIVIDFALAAIAAASNLLTSSIRSSVNTGRTSLI
jgi:hypothetical protein